jgi:hypothetical protein
MNDSKDFFSRLHLITAFFVLVMSSLAVSPLLHDGLKVTKNLSLIIGLSLLLLDLIYSVRKFEVKFSAISALILLFAIFAFVPPLIKNPLIALNINYITNVGLIILYFALTSVFSDARNKKVAIVMILLLSRRIKHTWNVAKVRLGTLI